MNELVLDALTWVPLAGGAIWVLYRFVATRKRRLARQQEILDTIQVVAALRGAGQAVSAAYVQCHLARNLHAVYPPYHVRFGIRPKLSQNIYPILAWCLVALYACSIVRWVNHEDELYASYERAHRIARSGVFAERIDKLKSQAGEYARDPEIWKDEHGQSLAREVNDHLWDIGTALISWSTVNEPSIDAVIQARADALASSAGRLTNMRKPLYVTRIAMLTAGEPEPGSPKAEFIRFREFLSSLRILPALWSALYRRSPENRVTFMWRRAWVNIGTFLALCVWLILAISAMWWRERIPRDELATAIARTRLPKDGTPKQDGTRDETDGIEPPTTDAKQLDRGA